MAPTDALTTFQAHRGALMGLAYRMLGQVADAEDVVQEAWLRWSRVATEEVEDPRAYLVRVTTRLAIDRLRRVRARREEYVGTWLPEPIPTASLSAGDDVADQVVLAETLSTAMLVVFETLSPVERAVFILREVFGYSHAQVAEAIGRSEPPSGSSRIVPAITSSSDVPASRPTRRSGGRSPSASWRRASRETWTR